MGALLIAVIYGAFISLGLPDSLLGSGWQVMREELGAPLPLAGVISAIISIGTIIAALMSDRLNKRFGSGVVVAVCVLVTAASLFGFSVSGRAWLLCVFALPYGLGAGSIDAALNNYVALHFSSRHMNWLHGCWGVGAAVSPFIMGYALENQLGWNAGYRTVSLIQAGVAAVIFCSLPLWKGRRSASEATDGPPVLVPLSQILKIKGVKYVLPAFMGYCGMEATCYLWGSSYLAIHRGVPDETAASFASLFFIGITAGRFLSGLVSNRIGDKNIIRIGFFVALTGIAAIALPLETDLLCFAGLATVGFGCAPIFPAIIHATPDNFGKENSQAVIGVQMAAAYSGTTALPFLFGLLADNVSMALFPAYLLFFGLLMLVMTERLNRLLKK